MAWSEALWKYCTRPQEYSQHVIKWNDSFVAIYDGFPKSRIHYLILPRIKIDGIESLTPDHVPMIKEMKAFANQIISIMDLNKEELIVGFHAIPSMKQCHMHVLTLDYQGSGLKKKHHYNSFVTEFFIPVDALIDRLTKGKLHLDKELYENLLKVPLACHKCAMQFKTLPKLKDHLNNCQG